MRKTLLALSLLGTLSLPAQELMEQEFYVNGHLKSTSYAMGAKVWFIAYHENGRVKEMGGYMAGRPDGEWRQFDDHGQLLAHARFNEGHREGTWSFMTTNGQVIGRLQFRNGSLLRGEQFDPMGALIAERDYQ